MKRSWLLLVVLAGTVLWLDVATKHWASETLIHRAPVEVIGEFVRLTYTRNSGVAFGLGAGVKFPYAIFSVVAAGIILYLFASRRVTGAARQVALALILGGALGNLVDRLSSGEVVDFIEIGWDRWHWPIFNVADSAVSVGVALFAIAWSQKEHGPTPEASAPVTSEPPFDESYDEPFRPGAAHGGATRSLPGDGADRPVA